MAKYTEGPWGLYDGGIDSQFIVVTSEAGDGPDIAQLIGDELSEEEMEANAKLIAAAPDLLNALNGVFDAAEDGGDMNDIDWDMLRAALYKATE